MPMLLLALAGGALFAIRRHKINWALSSNSWLMVKLFSLMESMVPNGCIALCAKNATTCNVLLQKQRNKLKQKDGLLSAGLMSAKGINVKRVTHSTIQGRSAKWVTYLKRVTKRVTHFGCFMYRNMANRRPRKKAGMVKPSRQLKRKEMLCLTKESEIKSGKRRIWTRQRNFGQKMTPYLPKKDSP